MRGLLALRGKTLIVFELSLLLELLKFGVVNFLFILVINGVDCCVLEIVFALSGILV